jgi:hypothetical protein
MTAPLARWLVALTAATLMMGLLLIHAAVA